MTNSQFKETTTSKLTKPSAKGTGRNKVNVTPGKSRCEYVPQADDQAVLPLLLSEEGINLDFIKESTGGVKIPNSSVHVTSLLTTLSSESADEMEENEFCC